MKKVLYLLCMCSFLSIFNMSVFCMPSLDVIKEYEKNIEAYCNEDEEFLISSDNGDYLTDPKGVGNAYDFQYYVTKNGNVSQVYRGNEYICIVKWTNNNVTEYMRYIIKNKQKNI